MVPCWYGVEVNCGSHRMTHSGDDWAKAAPDMKRNETLTSATTDRIVATWINMEI